MSDDYAPRVGLLADPESMRALLNPRSVAIIGATERLQYGGRLLQNLIRVGFPGPLYPINPRRETVFDLKCYPSIDDLPEVAELAAVIIPAPAVPDALRQAAARGTRAAVVISAGFAETQDGDGQRLQDELREIAAETGLRICGPNCLGLANLHAHLWSVANTLTPVDEKVLPGPVAIVAQSGATAFGPLLAIARERGIGIHSIISTGNEADLDFADYAAYLLQQPEVGAVAGIVEGVRDGRKLFRVAALARELDKPVVVLKLGRSDVGRSAAKLHTAAMAGDHAVSMAAFRQAGIIVVDDYDVLLETAAAFTSGRRPAGKRIAVVSHSGGIGGLLGDLCGDLGLDVPSLAPDTRARLATILAGRGAAANPADITMHYQLDTFGEIVRLLLADPSFDALAIASTGVNAARHVVAAVAESDKPLLFTWVGAIEGEGRETLRTGGVPSFLLPGRCATAMKALVDFAAWRRMPAPAAIASLSAPRADSNPRTIAADLAGSPAALLASIGVGLPAERICRTEKEAIAAAKQMGYPVAVKGISPELTHKSDVGAVILGVGRADDLRLAFRSAVANLERAGGTVSGVLVQKMVDTRRGLELALGVIVDPAWGPVVMLALGGVGVEALGLASWRSCPVAESEVDGMISEIRGLDRLLGEHRGRPALDRESLRRAVSGLSWVAAANPGVTMEINPLVVLPRGDGVVAVDVRVAR